MITSSVEVVRPTKKFVHFMSSKQGRSEMYGFGFHQIIEVEQVCSLIPTLNTSFSCLQFCIVQIKNYNHADL